MLETQFPSIIYGAVPSWHLGRSPGIDPLCTCSKTCSFDCVYCQLGRTVHPFVGRCRFVTAEVLRKQLTTFGEIAIDIVTFSGVGEPTLAANFSELIASVRRGDQQPSDCHFNKCFAHLATRRAARFDML